MQHVAGYGEDRSGGEGGVDGCGRRVRPAKDSWADGSAIGFGCARECDGEKQDEECVQAERFCEIGVEQGDECAGGAASGTVEAKELADGTSGVKARPCWRVGEEDCEQWDHAHQ